MEELFVERHSYFRGRFEAAVRPDALFDVTVGGQGGYCECTAGQHQRGGEIVRIYGNRLRVL